jgi:hypothetical protein
MSRLIVNPGTPQAWEIPLKPGTNSLGRGDANNFKISDPSVSGSHCQIVVGEDSVLLKDCGSTNGTFVGGAQIQERQLENGQAIRLGSVEMVFLTNGGAAPVPVAVAAARPAVRVAAAASAVPVAMRAEAQPAVPPPVMQADGSVLTSGERYCKFHPRLPARHLCPACNRAYCDLCINLNENAAIAAKTCRNCGAAVVPFQYSPPPVKSFYSTLPGAFGYPFKGAGIMILICATIAFAALHFISGGLFGLVIKVVLFGFVFLFMQNVILTTTSDEKAELCFPEASGLFGAAWQLAGTVAMSFFLPIALEVAKLYDVAVPSEAIIASYILAGIYFPMALLAVAMKDTVLAANPLIVIPAMVKVPVKYGVTAALALAVFGIRQLGSIVSSGAGMLMFSTRQMNTFFAAVAIQMVLAVVSVYLLVVTMRVLGLFYNSSKQKLGWYHH